jgi:predicted dehydrogenase
MLTRRSVLAGSAAFAAQISRAAETVRLPRPMRVAILGFDGHTAEITARLPQLPDVTVAAICDQDPQALAKAAKNPRLAAAKQYADYSQMLEREKLDIVAVCNNDGERAEAILACAARKLDVIAEKPFALTTADLTGIRRAVEQQRIHLGMLLPMRFDSQFLAMKQIVAQGLIGEVAQIGSQKSYKAGERAAWYKKRATYGGTIAWIGIHMIDLMRHISGREFKETFGYQAHIGFPNLGEMENVTASLFRLDNGGVAALRMDYLRTETSPTHEDDRLRLAGTKGVLEYQAGTGVTLMTTEQKPHRIESLPPQQSVFLDFLNSSYNGKPAALTLADCYRVTEITIAAQTAADKGQTIQI